MPIFVYILLGIALLIALILITKVRIIVSYTDELKVYAKILFIKIRIVPEKEKKSKKKKDKKKDTQVKEAPQKEESIVKKIWSIKSLVADIIARFLNKLHFKFLRLRVVIACNNAAKTALLYSGVNQGITYLIEFLDNVSNVDVPTHSNIPVDTNFISQKSEFEGKIELYIRVLPLITVGLHAIKEYIKYKSTKEDEKYGRDQAK